MLFSPELQPNLTEVTEAAIRIGSSGDVVESAEHGSRQRAATVECERGSKMALIWGWGPFSIKPQGEELLLSERVRAAFRRHNTSLDSSVDEFVTACREMQSAVEDLWKAVAKRVQSNKELEIPKGGEVDEPWPGPPEITIIETKEEPLVRNLIEASLIASLVGIEYEIKGALSMSAKFPTSPEGPAFWQIWGQATDTATHRAMPGFGFSDRFDPANRNAVEAAFLVAAARAYVGGVQAIAPFLPKDEQEQKNGS